MAESPDTRTRSRRRRPGDAGDAGVVRRAVWAEHSSLHTALELIRSGAAKTRLDIENLSGLGRATVADRVGRLVALGLIDEGEGGVSTGGRAPRILRFRSEAAVVAVAYVSTTTLGVALADLSGRLLVEHHEPSDIGIGPQATVERLAVLFDWVMTENGGGRPLWGVGLALSAPVEHVEELPFSVPIVHGLPAWDGYPLRSILARRYGVPVWIETDAHLMALGEMRAGRGEGSPDLLFVKISSGIAAGLCSGGRLHRGAQGASGSIGHLPSGEETTTVCRCGSHGCLELMAGGVAIGREGTALAQSGVSPYLAEVLARHGSISAADVSVAAQHGDRPSVDILVRAGRLIGATLATLVDFYNPSLVVIGGGVAQAGDMLLAAIREVVYGRSLPLVTRELRIVRSSLGHTASLVGAALLVVDELFSEQVLPQWIDHGSPMESPVIRTAIAGVAAEFPDVVVPPTAFARPLPTNGQTTPAGEPSSSTARTAPAGMP